MVSDLDKKKLLIIGPYPPPFGGVSIHIKRLIALLNSNFVIYKIDESSHKKPNLFNLRSYNFFLYIQLVAKSNIIHIHSGHYLLRFLHFCTTQIFNKKLIITVHAYEEMDKSMFEIFIDRFIFKHSSQVIFVSKEISEKFMLQNSIIKNAFLPPHLEEEEQLPPNLEKWIEEKRRNGYYIGCANASRLDKSRNQDLYGLDLSIEAAKLCREDNLKIAFVFVVSDTSGVIKIEFYEDLIKKYGLNDLFYLHKKSLSFINLIAQAEIIFRPTNTDGDALTVREGLFLNKKVIASDVVKRPRGTYIFKNRNLNSLMDVIRNVRHDLDNNSVHVKPYPEFSTINAADYKNFYLDNVYN